MSQQSGGSALAATPSTGYVRRQFREHPGIMDGSEEPDSVRAVTIATDGAIREMVIPGTIISRSAPSVAMATARAESCCSVPSMMPGFSRN